MIIIQNKQLFDKTSWLINPIEVKSHDFINRMIQNPKRISIDTRFLSRGEAHERLQLLIKP